MAKESTLKKKTKKKGGKRMGPEAVALKAKSPKADNPFESIWSRRKFDILGKKCKGKERSVGLARSRAIEKREKTLWKEYEQSLKASVFVDKRMGEHNDELGEFDKGIIRSQRERLLKVGKKSNYNLSDGEEEDFEGPALGGPSERGDFDAGILSDDDLKDDDLEAAGSKRKLNILKHLNENRSRDSSEGGFDRAEERHKSKKEIMEEIIMKSKLGKMQKAKQKEENEKLMEELDKRFTSLVESRVVESLSEPGKMNDLKALAKGTPNGSVKKIEAPVIQGKEQPDSYDKMVFEMAMDVRARPSERTKTAEEIAQEEKERLEALEEERKKRMQPTAGLSDEDEEKTGEEPTKRPRAISRDDLGDSFSFDEDTRTKQGWINEILERRDDDNSESEEDDDSSEKSKGGEKEESDDDDNEESDEGNREQGDALSLKDWEQSDDEDPGVELEDEEEETQDCDQKDGEMQSRVHKKLKGEGVQQGEEKGSSEKEEKSKNEVQTATQCDIPFLIDAPKNFEELLALVENHSNADILVIVNRIRANNAIQLAAENRKRMQVFYGVLLQYFAVLANKKPLNFELLNMLVKPLIEISMEIPYFAAFCAHQRLLRMRTQFCEAIKNPENGCWPSAKTLSLLRLWHMIFPCSDFRHAVMTPLILLVCEYLMRCPISSGRDTAIGCFLCSMVLSVAKQSQKFCPEAVLFIRTLLMAASDKKSAPSQESEFYHLMELKSLSPLLRIQGDINEIRPLNFLVIMDLPASSSFFSSDNFRVSVLSSVVETLKGFVEIHGGLSSFPEIFLPISTLLHEVGDQRKFSEALKEKLKDVAGLIEKKADEHHMHRQPLQMRKHRPLPIKMVNPKFEENFVKGRDYDPDHERAERRKLKKLIKQEAKGAAKELLKDAYFLSELKRRHKAQLDEEKAEKSGKALAFLQEQEHAFKSGQLGKGRGKKRRR